MSVPVLLPVFCIVQIARGSQLSKTLGHYSLSDGIDRFILYGGWGAGVAQIYNTASDTWKALPSMGVGSEMPAGYVHNGHTVYAVLNTDIFYLSLKGLDEPEGELVQTEWRRTANQNDEFTRVRRLVVMN